MSSNATIIDTLVFDRAKGFRFVDDERSVPDIRFVFTKDPINDGRAVGMVDWTQSLVTLAWEMSDAEVTYAAKWVSSRRHSEPPTDPTYFRRRKEAGDAA